MKCDECLNILEAYVDGEAGERNVEQVQTHLLKCESCTLELEALTAEAEAYARYDRELQISPVIWNGIAARIAAEGNGASRSKSSPTRWFAGLFVVPRFGFAFSAAALVLAAVFVGLIYLKTRQSVPQNAEAANRSNAGSPKISTGTNEAAVFPVSSTTPNPATLPRPINMAAEKPRISNRPKAAKDDPGVLFTDAAYTDIEDEDTANHLEQAQNLLISVRTIQLSDDDQEIDVSYEKAESRRLLNENIVLRRDAEMAGKFPAKTMLGSLEPFLIDIANLPDKAPAKDVRQIRDRVEKTEIVAELRAYD
jgi:putative zinc finger protein